MNSRKIIEVNKELPIKFADADFNDFKDKTVENHIKEIIRDGDSWGLYLHGETGTGKTRMVYAILNYINNKTELSSVLIKSTDIIDAVKAGYKDLSPYDDGYEKQQDEINFLKDLGNYKGLLIIDDIGAEKFSEAVITEYYKIINERYEWNRPTIYTSNYSLKDLINKVGERIVSRIIRTTKPIELKNE